MLSTTADLRISRTTNDARRSEEPHSSAAMPHVAAPVKSVDLLRGEKTVGIIHNGALYRLQATKLGKLILTK